MVSKIGIHWFRQDLRLDNNPSLISLSKKVNKIVPIYILDLNQRIGSVSKWWLENSLDSLSDSITKQKGKLNIFIGNPEKIISSIIPPASNKRTTIEAHNGCITCGACVSAIADQLQSSDPVGLAALNRLLMLMLEERDSIGAERLGEFIEEVQTLSLQAAEHAESICPADIPLSSALEQLKSFAANYGDNG